MSKISEKRAHAHCENSKQASPEELKHRRSLWIMKSKRATKESKFTFFGVGNRILSSDEKQRMTQPCNNK